MTLFYSMTPNSGLLLRDKYGEILEHEKLTLVQYIFNLEFMRGNIEGFWRYNLSSISLQSIE
jgi:hypothetical protein